MGEKGLREFFRSISRKLVLLLGGSRRQQFLGVDAATL